MPGSYNKDLTAGIVIVSVIILVQTWIMGIAIAFLDIGLLLGLAVWAVNTKERVPGNVHRLYLIAVGLQCFHFMEEYLTGFNVRFPSLFGIDTAWSVELFTGFNLVWLGLLVLNGYWMFGNSRLSYLLVYFFAITGGILNGIGHPLLSLAAGGYFPGLLTSPLVLIAGILLLSRLVKHAN